MKRVVVTGIGVVSPIGNNVESFWESLKNGRCGIDYITRYDASNDRVKIAAEVKDFDPLRFMDMVEVRKTDPYALYAISAAEEAMNDSAISDIDPCRLGVYVGSGIGGIGTTIRESNVLNTKGAKRVSPFLVPMMISNIAAGTIAIKHNARGVCLPIVTACATSTHSIGEAFRAIKHGYADAIITGGAEACIVPLAVVGFTNCMALSEKNEPIGSCIPFDKRRDGFVMGEGAGILVLEEYEHAVKRGAKIYCEISGYGNTCDAYHITAPHPEAVGASEAIKQALFEGGYGEESLYINAHGTSTPLNDKIETLAIKKAIGDNAYKAHISSTKSMTGHMIGAAGGVEAIVCILAMKYGIVPPTIGLEEPDEECDLNYTPCKAVNAHIDAALSISLGFGGHNGVIFMKRGV